MDVTLWPKDSRHLRHAKWGLEIKRPGCNSWPLMSALPPKADIAERDMSALLLPQLAIFPRDPPRLVAQERLMF